MKNDESAVVLVEQDDFFLSDGASRLIIYDKEVSYVAETTEDTK